MSVHCNIKSKKKMKQNISLTALQKCKLASYPEGLSYRDNGIPMIKDNTRVQNKGRFSFHLGSAMSPEAQEIYQPVHTSYKNVLMRRARRMKTSLTVVQD